MWSLLGVALAGAHQPHTILVDVAAAADGRMWAILDPHDTSQLLASVDFGAHWDFVGGPPTEGDLVALAWSGETLYAASADTLWSSPDGVSWTSEPVTGVRDVSAWGDVVALATTEGLIVDGAAPIGDVAFVEVTVTADGLAAVDAEGRVWRDGAALPRISFDRKALSVAISGGSTFVGTDAGVLLYTDAWTDCGRLPVTSEDTYAHEVHLVVAGPDGRAAAATGREGMFVSADACATWELHPVGGEPPSYGEAGYATDPSEGYTWGAFTEEGMAIAGFPGFASSEGARYTWATILPAVYSRGISIVAWPDSARVVMGEYGGGAVWTSDGGASWEGSGVGLEGQYGNDLVAAADAFRTGELWHVTDLLVHHSEDGGETWIRDEVDMERAREVRLLSDGVYVLGGDLREDAGPRIGRFDGEGWEVTRDLADATGENALLDLQEVDLDGPARLALMQKPAEIWLDRDGWERVGVLDGFAAGMATWPAEEPQRLIFASTEGGLVLSDDLGGAWRAPEQPPIGTPRHLFAADDGTLMLITRAGVPWWSDDGGESWSQADGVIPAAVHDAAAGPGFADHGFAVLATYAGPWWTADAGRSWHRYPQYQRYEATSFHLACTGTCAPYADRSHGIGGGLALEPGDEVRFSFRGSRFRAVPAEGLSVTVDGEPSEGDLPEGWHDVVLTAEAAVRLDLVETWGAGEIAPDVVLDRPRRCGCGDGRALVVLALWPWRRRRRS